MPLTKPTAAQINFDATNITDPLILLNSGEAGSADKDTGIVIERGNDTNVGLIYDESTDYFAFINTTETGTTSGNVSIASYANLQCGTLQMADEQIIRPELKDYSETKIGVAAASTVDLDMTSGNVFTVTADQNTTFTFSNPSHTGKSCSFTLVWTQGSSDWTATWPASVDWAGGSAPDVTSGSGKIDIYTFFTMDAGTIWYGFQAGADMG